MSDDQILPDISRITLSEEEEELDDELSTIEPLDTTVNTIISNVSTAGFCEATIDTPTSQQQQVYDYLIELAMRELLEEVEEDDTEYIYEDVEQNLPQEKFSWE